jgi:hypothetical protein
MRRTTAGGLAFLLAAAVTAVAVAAPPPTGPGPSAAYRDGPETLHGTAVLLTEVLKSTGLAFDTEPVARQVVLKGDNGSITPLISDDASRALFKDERLLNRRTEVSGRRHPGLPYLQVVSFRVEENGRLRTPEYYCEICTISVRYPQSCPCCQGDMVLRMKPEPR